MYKNSDPRERRKNVLQEDVRTLKKYNEKLNNEKREKPTNLNRDNIGRAKVTGEATYLRGKYDLNDMEMYMLIKSNDNKHKNRSRSLTRTNYKDERHDSRKRHGDRPKQWHEILANHENPPYRKTTRSRRSRSVSPAERDTDTASYDKKYYNSDRQTPTDQLTSLFFEDPIKTLHYLIYDLKTSLTPQDGRTDMIFNLIQQTLLKIPNCKTMYETPVTAATQSKVTSNKPSVEVSKKSYELMRKERDDLKKQLVDMKKVRENLERKCCTFEAQLVRLESDQQRIEDERNKLISEKKELMEAFKAKSRMNAVKNTHEKNELDVANEYIHGLQDAILNIKDIYNTKLQEMVHIIHDAIDESRNETTNIENIFGECPDIDVNFNDENEIPSRPATPDIFKLEVDKDLRLKTSNLKLDDRMDEAEAFHSFVSVPDHPK